MKELKAPFNPISTFAIQVCCMTSNRGEGEGKITPYFSQKINLLKI